MKIVGIFYEPSSTSSSSLTVINNNKDAGILIKIILQALLHR